MLCSIFVIVSGLKSDIVTEAGVEKVMVARAGTAQPAPNSRICLFFRRDAMVGEDSHRAMMREAHQMERPVVSSFGDLPKGLSGCAIGCMDDSFQDIESLHIKIK